MPQEYHPNPYPHDPNCDPTPGEWETDTGAEPALIYAPPADGSEESILIATVADDSTEQAATNARVLASSAAAIAGADAVDLLRTIYDEIDMHFQRHRLEPSKRERNDGDEGEEKGVDA
jgi:hypothetical protein